MMKATGISKLALVGVVCGGLAALTGGVPAAETSAPAQPFWQLQPSSRRYGSLRPLQPASSFLLSKEVRGALPSSWRARQEAAGRLGRLWVTIRPLPRSPALSWSQLLPSLFGRPA